MGYTNQSKSNSEGWGMGFLLVFFPDEDQNQNQESSNKKKPNNLNQFSPSSSPFKRSNSSHLIFKAQSIISICLLLLFTTLLLFTLSTLPSATTTVSAVPRRLYRVDLAGSQPQFHLSEERERMRILRGKIFKPGKSAECKCPNFSLSPNWNIKTPNFYSIINCQNTRAKLASIRPVMARPPPSNLLDESLGDTARGGGGGRMILVEDCVDTSGNFVVHHLLKRALHLHSSDFVVFLSFAHPFSHYDRVLRKMGCNLSVLRDNKRLLFYDMLTLDRLDRNRGKASEDIVIALYGEVQKAVEVLRSQEGKHHITIVIDDISLMEVDAKGSSNLVLDFLRYCYSLTAQFNCSLVALSHEDVYSTIEQPNLLLQLEYLADLVIKVEPLATGLAADVHGQLTVLNRNPQVGSGKSRSRMYNFQFRIKDSSVEYFYPGSKT